MDIKLNWDKIRKHFNKSFSSNFHVSISSIGADDTPTVTPIGSLFLNNEQTGYYFEKYPTKLPTYAKINKKICVLAVNINTWFWIMSLFKGRFNKYPAIKLYGMLGDRREATEIEISRLNKRMKATKLLRGSKYLWGDMKLVREIKFTNAEGINLGKMTMELV